MAAELPRPRLEPDIAQLPALTNGHGNGSTQVLPEPAVGTTRPRPPREYPTVHQSRARHARVPAALLLADGTAWAAMLALAGATLQWSLVFAALLAGTYAAFGLYRSRLTLSVLDDLPRLAGGAVLVTLLMMSFEGLQTAFFDSRTHMLGAALLAGALIGRMAGYGLIRLVRRRGLVTHRTLVVGAGSVGRDVAEKIEEHPEFGLRLVGFVDAENPGKPLLAQPLVGDHRQLESIVREHDVSVVIVAFGGVWANDLVDVLRSARGSGCDIFVVPRLYEVQAPGRPDYLRSIPLLRLNKAPELSLGWHVKRAADIVLASLALVLLSPVLAATALAVRLETGPGVLFRQQRIGRHGRRFTLLKFRSYGPAHGHEADTRWTREGDKALGPVGRFIRRTSIDELPQLFNVVKGDMSLVGPRPERPYFVDVFAAELPAYRSRHRVPAGLTGWAAVNGLRGDTSIKERVHFDNAYIDNWSLWLDAKILMRTVTQVARGAGG